MVYKGAVMDVQREHIIVITKDSRYLKLKKKGNITLGKEIMFIEDDVIKEREKHYKPLIGVAAAIILLIISTLGQFGMQYFNGFQTFAVVSLDINPSLEFKVNDKRIVKDIIPLNRDGEAIIKENMIGIKIEDAVDLAINEAMEEDYLNEDNNVVLISTTIIKNKEKESNIIKNKIISRIEEDNKLENMNYVYLEADKKGLKEAKKHKLSPGKYEMYRVITEKNPGISIEEIKEKRISEILEENKTLINKEQVKINKIYKVKEENGHGKDKNKFISNKKSQRKDMKDINIDKEKEGIKEKNKGKPVQGKQIEKNEKSNNKQNKIKNLQQEEGNKDNSEKKDNIVENKNNKKDEINEKKKEKVEEISEKKKKDELEKESKNNDEPNKEKTLSNNNFNKNESSNGKSSKSKDKDKETEEKKEDEEEVVVEKEEQKKAQDQKDKLEKENENKDKSNKEKASSHKSSSKSKSSNGKGGKSKSKDRK